MTEMTDKNTPEDTRPSPPRVGCILKLGNDVIEFLGYGVLLGYEVPPTGIARLHVLYDDPDHNGNLAKMQLDNGDIVWGCECWWNTEARIHEELQIADDYGIKIVRVFIERQRELHAQRVASREARKAMRSKETGGDDEQDEQDEQDHDE